MCSLFTILENQTILGFLVILVTLYLSSKRKRVRSEIVEDEPQQTQNNESSRKKIKFNSLDDTLDELLPAKQRLNQSKKRINGKHVIVTKKRHASIGIQCDSAPVRNLSFIFIFLSFLS